MPTGVYKRTPEEIKRLTKLSRQPRKVRGGGYQAVHKWLVKHYGNANRCESIVCSGKSKVFHWAKLKDKRYEHKRENFIMLCSSCHRLYDQTAGWIEKMRKSKIGSHLSLTTKERISKSMMGKNVGILNGSWKGGKYAKS
jgi:hypothetical protein